MTLHGSLRKVMPSAIDEPAIDRMWGGITERRVARARRRARAWVVAAAAIVVLVVGLAWRRHDGSDAGPIRFTDGGAIATLTAARTYALSDGSKIDLTAGATFTTGRNAANAFEGTLRGGAATFDVAPGGPRRWVIDCGIATVEVVGTRFVIDARPERVTVHVDRGHVRVSSAAGVSDLFPGDDLTVPAPIATAPSVTASANPEPEAIRPEALPDAPLAPIAKAPAWTDSVHDGNYASAYATLGPNGIAHEAAHASIDQLLALADVARLSGHPADAVAPLSRVASEGRSDPRAPLAAFSLGRLELDSLGRPADAAKAFARAIDLGLPTSLVEDAHVRLVEARAKSGDSAGARSAYDAYVRTFPQGTRAAAMRRWLGDD